MQPDQRVQDQEDRLEVLDGIREALAVGGSVQPERRSGDDFYRERIKADLGSASNAFQSLAHDRQRVLGGKEEHLARASDRELPQAGRPGRHTHSDIQGEEAFAAFGFASEDADRLFGPKPFY
jgi:hypothetical protein